MSKLSTREKRLLGACVAVLATMVCVILLKTYLDAKTGLQTKIRTLSGEKEENEVWLADEAFQKKRGAWLDKSLPTTDSLGRAQGTLLEDIQNAALEQEVKILRTTPNTPEQTPNYDEVAVQVNLRGDMATLLAWLAGLQSPERFVIVKALEIEPDSRAREKTPQVFVNITLARWFKPAGA
jgi:Tfp pilus assembly protein PilO